MFFVSDNRKERSQMIRSMIKKQPTIALLLAAIDFEWSLRRTIFALGVTPTKELRKVRMGGPTRYKEVWKDEVFARTGVRLPQVITNWDMLTTKAFPMRHKIVHGIAPYTSPEHAAELCEVFLQSATDLATFATNNGTSIFGKPIRRLKPWQR